MGHIDATVEVLIGFGNAPGSAFNTVVKRTFSETGLGAFCMTGTSLHLHLHLLPLSSHEAGGGGGEVVSLGLFFWGGGIS